jgi:tRNA pseudouridine55 synthase
MTAAAGQGESHEERPIAGVLLIDKPLGYTSMAVCANIRGRLKAGGAPRRVKVGHGGTLDPLATGLLVVLVGRATRLCDRIMADTKEYAATIDLAHTSATHDLESETIAAGVGVPPTRAEVDLVLAEFVGTVEQVPPAHSAVKVGGRRAYHLARAGAIPPLVPRPVRIDAIRVAEYAWPSLRVEITCGKGTYIRALARDVGAALGSGGVLTALRRTRSGAFSVAEASTLAALPDPLDPWGLPPVPGGV